MSDKVYTINVEIDGDRAVITMPNEEVLEAELNEGETEDQFMARLEGIVRQTFGDKLKTLTITEGAA